MHRLACLAVALLAVACSPSRPFPPLRPAPAFAGPSPEPLTWKARAAFDSALATGDTARIATLFAPGAFVVAPGGDTISAHDAIATYFGQVNHDAGPIRFSWGREGEFERCVGGAREQLIYTTHVTRTDGSATVLTGRLSVFWRADSSGAIQVAWLAFPKRELARKLTTGECPSIDAVVWRAWRWAFSVYPTPALARGGARHSFESTLRDRGWTEQDCSCLDPLPRYTPVSDWSKVALPALVAVQRHLNGRWVAELAGGRSPHGTTLGAQTFPNRDYAQVRLRFSGGFVQTIVSYERWPFQIGAGPTVQFASWRMRDSVIPYSTGGYPSFTDTKWSSASVGLVGDLRYNMLLGPRTFLTFRGQLRAYPGTKTPATAHFPTAALQQSEALFGIGVGLLR